MHYESELKFLRDMLSKCHLQNSIIDSQSSFNEAVDQNYGKFLIAADLYPEIKSNTIYKVRDKFFCNYIIMELFGAEDKSIFIIGPYLTDELSHQQMLELGERMNILPGDIRELEVYYGAVPVIKEEHLIFAMINTFADAIFGGSDNYEIEDISYDDGVTFMLGEMTSKSEPQDNSRNIKIMEERYDFENELMQAISSGNEKKAEHMMTSFSAMALERRITDQLRNVKNYCIIMNTLLRKAAENGGVHPVYLDKVSSDYAHRIENLHMADMAPAFMLELAKTYCKLVRKHAIKDYSPVVQNTIIKIESDLTGDLTLHGLAKFNNVSTGYLSGLFKRETGYTLTEYVNLKRVSYSKRLLKNTNLQIQTIAQHCGILDLHYFCRVFKKATGKTPTEYRADKK